MKETGDLVGYSDSDYAGNVEYRKRTFGYVLNQPIVTLSTIEVEYVAATSCV